MSLGFARNLSRIAISVSLLVLALATLGCSPQGAIGPAAPTSPVAEDNGQVDEKVIYGEDNRKDYYQVTDANLKKLADSTAALISSNDLVAAANGRYAIKGSKFGVTYDLCSTEKFFEQNVAAFCSGFLVGPDTLVTAGHCVSSAKDCSTTSFVFGFAYKSASAAPTHANADDVYKCKSIVRSEAAGQGADFAVIKLDRTVKNRTALKIRRSGEVGANASLVVIGHPSGLPTKIADGANVRSTTNAKFFVANLDTYGGNSGSAVFNAATSEVEGILVRGERDFEWTPQGCSKSFTCKNDACRGEDVTRISETLPYLETRRRR